MADVKKLAEELVNLTVKEVNELATILKEEYGIEPQLQPLLLQRLLPPPERLLPLRRAHST